MNYASENLNERMCNIFLPFFLFCFLCFLHLQFYSFLHFYFCFLVHFTSLSIHSWLFSFSVISFPYYFVFFPSNDGKYFDFCSLKRFQIVERHRFANIEMDFYFLFSISCIWFRDFTVEENKNKKKRPLYGRNTRRTICSFSFGFNFLRSFSFSFISFFFVCVPKDKSLLCIAFY